MKRNSGSSLFLMELILAILIFAMASTVCVRLFVSSYLLSKNSEELNRGILWGQNMAEVYLASGSELTELKDIFQEEVEVEEGRAAVYFDGDWASLPLDKISSSKYCVELVLKEREGDLQRALVSVHRYGDVAGHTIYEIPLSKFVG